MSELRASVRAAVVGGRSLRPHAARRSLALCRCPGASPRSPAERYPPLRPVTFTCLRLPSRTSPALTEPNALKCCETIQVKFKNTLAAVHSDGRDVFVQQILRLLEELLRRRHVARRGPSVAAAVPLRHGAAVRRRAHQLAGAGGGLRGARALRGRSLHRGRRAAHLRRDVLLAAVARARAAERPRLAGHTPDRRPHPRDIDAGRRDDAAEAARLRHGGGRAADLRRRHQAQPSAPAALGQRLRRAHHPRAARRRARAARAHPRARAPRPGPQDPAPALQPEPRHQMKPPGKTQHFKTTAVSCDETNDNDLKHYL